MQMTRVPRRAVDYRVWIARCESWQPAHNQDIPPRAVAIRPAEPGTYSRRAAARYVEAFNRAALSRGHARVWAVAVPVTIVYEGDPRPGELLESRQSDQDAPARSASEENEKQTAFVSPNCEQGQENTH
jgi:hypothetical protein